MIIIPSTFGVQSPPRGTISLLTFEQDPLNATTGLIDLARPERTYSRVITGGVVRDISAIGRSGKGWANTSTGNSSGSIGPDLSTDFAFAFGDFTFEWWNIVSDTTGNNLMRVFGNTTLPQSGYYVKMGLGYNAQLKNVQLITNPSGLVADTLTASVDNILPINQWFHTAITRNNGTIKVWIGGTERISFFFNSSLSSFATIPFRIGWDRSSSGYTLYGAFDDFKVSNYAVYTANFTPSQSLTL